MQPIDFTTHRDAWDPDDNTPSRSRSLDSVTGFELHHTGAAGPRSLSFDDKRVWLTNIERDHEVARGWSDIFYNVFVFADGEIWEGRRSDRSSQTSVSQYLTVHIPGNSPKITEVQYQALLKVARSVTTDPGRIRGHSDRAATACPGDTGRATLARLQKEITVSLADLPPTQITPQDFRTHAQYLAAVERDFIGLDDPDRVASRSVLGIIATRVDNAARKRDEAISRKLTKALGRISDLEGQVAALEDGTQIITMDAIVDELQKRLES